MLVLSSLSLHAQSTNQTQVNNPDKQLFTIAINETSYPYHFVDEQGNASGLMPELWRLWASKQKVDVEFVSLPWIETLEKVKKSDIDIHAGLSIIDSRKKAFLFSKPLFPLYTHVYVNSELTQVSSMDELEPFAIGVVAGSAHIDLLNNNFPQLTQKLYDNRHDLYKAAIKKEVLVFTGLEKLSSNYQLYSQLNTMFPPYKRLRYQQGEYGVAVANDNKVLMDFIELGMGKISETEKSNVERKWLGMDKEKDSLTVAFPPDYAPYAALSPTGQPQGLLIDMWKLWSQKTGTKITFISRELSQILALIKDDEVDVLVGFPENWLDENYFSMTNAIYQSKAQMFVSNKIPQVNSVAEFVNTTKNGSIGVWEKTPFKQQLIKQYPNVKLKNYPTISALIKAAELGEIAAFVSHVDFMELILLKSNLQPSFYKLPSPVFNSLISPLVKKGNKRLMNIIDAGFKELALEDLINIESRWLVSENNYYRSLFEKVTLTEQEKAFVAENNIIDVGVMKSLAPLGFINANGEFDGIDRDILDLIADRTGLSFNFVSYDSWHLLFKAMRSGDVDVITSITPTKKRSEHFLFTSQYKETPWSVLHAQTLGRKTKLSQFYGKKLGIVEDYYLLSELRESHPLITIVTVKNREEALRFLQQRKVDGVIENITSASRLLKQESLVNLMISVLEDVPPDSSHLGVSKPNIDLQNILNEGLLSISQEERNEINDKWFEVEISTGFDKDVVLRVALQASALIIIVLSVIIVWNRRLKSEITRREELEQSMKHMATHDDLTGLANRVLLKDRLNTAIEFHQRQSLNLAVLFLDLDGFKTINDTYGHDVGDELLLIVAQRLKSCVRKSDTVVRFGGDEFVLLLTGLHVTDEAAYVAEKVLELLNLPFVLSAATVNIGCSVGVAVYPEDGDNEVDLLKTADTLMYQVKAAGKNHYLFTEK